jgi:type I restriction enzyme, S subunit
MKQWTISTIGECCKVNMGQSPPSTTYNSTGDGLPFFQGKAEFGDPHPIPTKWCSKPLKIANVNDVLLSIRAPIGPTNIADQRCCIGRGLASISYPDYKYLFYYLKYKASELDSLGTGSTFKAISGNKLKTFPFPEAPIEERKPIVHKIEELFSELDHAEAQLLKAKKQLEAYRQSVLKYAFEGYFSSRKEWELMPIGKMLPTINNGYTPKAEKMKSQGEVQFLKVYNLTFDGTLNRQKNPVYIDKAVSETELKRSVTYPNDVLINIVGPPLGKVSLVPATAQSFNINQAIVLFRPNQSVLPEFLSFFMQSPKTIEWLENTSKATAGQFNVKVSTCREIPFPVLTIEEQHEVVNAIKDKLVQLDQLKAANSASLEHITSLRQSILDKAFTGQLV